jgi:hypothetical protein
VTFAAALFLGALALGQRASEAASGGPDISLSIDVAGGSDDCDTRPATFTGATCVVPVGQQFVVKGNVDSAAGLPDIDGDTQHGYAGFQFRLLHSAGLALNNPPGTDTELGFPAPFWPDCSSDARGDAESGERYDVVCFSSGAESLFLSSVVEVTYTCSSAGAQTLTMDDTGSYIHNDGHGNLPLDKEGDEALTVNCAGTPVVGGIAVPASHHEARTGTAMRREGAPRERAILIGTILGAMTAVLAVAAAAIYRGRRPD